MAKFVYEAMLVENGGLAAFFSDMIMNHERFAPSDPDDPRGGVSYYDISGGSGMITFTGVDVYAEPDWTLTSGRIDSVRFGTDWDAALVVTGLDMDVIPLHDALIEQDVLALLERLTRGDDKVIGSVAGDYLYGGRGADRIKGGDGRDVIVGGLGNDKLTGGAGSDEFFFGARQGKDVITDFDAKGGGRRQDYIQLTGDDDFTIRARGDDTILDFGNGSTLTLLGVDRSDFSRAGDIHWVEF
ncbi:calcium-binding protein [Rhizobium sp.]